MNELTYSMLEQAILVDDIESVKKHCLEYKSYYGTVNFSTENDLLYGHVLGEENSSYNAHTLEELKYEFKDTVDNVVIKRKELQDKWK